MVIDSQMSEMCGYSLKDAVLQLPWWGRSGFCVAGCCHCCQTEQYKNLSSYELWLLLEEFDYFQ